MNEKIPVPVTFNTYKHHFRFLFNQIIIWRNTDWKSTEKELLTIGENLLDFYTGNLTVNTICTECIHLLKDCKITDRVALTKWLYPQKYKKLKLSDSSEWIVKVGKNADRYVHIHPAKYSPHSIRVRARTLKTVVALMIKVPGISNKMKKNLQNVNDIRTEYLHLSPIKSLQRGKGIFFLWELFAKPY